MALTQGLIDSYWRRYNQRRALTGLPSSYQEVRGTLDPMLEAVQRQEAADKQRADDVSFRNRQLSMQEQSAKDAARAATISGIAQTGGLLSTGFLTNKALTNQATSNQMMANFLAGKSGGAAATTASAGAGSGGAILPAGVGSGLTAPGALQAPAYTAPTLATPTTFPAASLEAGAAPTASGMGTLPMLGAAALGAGALYQGGKYVQGKTGLDQFTSTAIAPIVGPTMAAIDYGKKAIDSISSSISDTFGF